MMPAKNLVRMVFANTVRSPRHFVLSTFGIVVGISMFVFLLALAIGVRNVLLGKIFPIEQVQVVAPRATLLGKDISKKLDDKVVAAIKARPEVAEALPRMGLVFPASGGGSFEGQELKFEVGGFADGIDPSFVKDDPKLRDLFKDWDEAEPNRVACVPPAMLDVPIVPVPAPVVPAAPAVPGAPAVTPTPTPGAGTPTPTPTPAPGVTPPAPPPVATRRRRGKNPCPEPTRYYCDESDNTCHHRVPVIVSNTLLELYNGQFATSHGLPVIGELEQFMVERGGLGRMRFEIGLGDTMVAGSNHDIDAGKRRRVEAVLVGISPKAMPIGVTMPISYIRRWNQEFVGDEAANTYSSIIVTLKDKDRLAVFSQWLQDEQNLRLEDSLGERFGTAIFVVALIFGVISIVIVTISAINIAHNFFMQVSERRREIGVLRAVGATRLDVRIIILGEAAVIGVLGGVLGVALAFGGSVLVDWWFASGVARFPFKPDTLFDFEPRIIAGGLVFSVIFCVLGGFLPARKASLLEPAQALAAQ
jgi:putative ABC transport system permease protein